MRQTAFVGLGHGGDLGWGLLGSAGVALVAGPAMILPQCHASQSQPSRLGAMVIGN